MASRQSRSADRSGRADSPAVDLGTDSSAEQTVESALELIEQVVMLDELDTAEVPPAGQAHADDIAVRGELAAKQTNWVRNVTPLEFETRDESTSFVSLQTSATTAADRDREELQQQLASKDELISALVAELEQVVEQLDRVQRTGSDRPRNPVMGAGFPAEVVEEHQQVLGDLQRVVQEWEELKASRTLGRIESELSELRMLMVRGVTATVTTSLSIPDEAAFEPNLDDVMARLGSGRNEQRDTETEDTGSNWESMKRQMLGEPAPAESPVAVEDDADAVLAGVASPSPVDLDEATPETLKKACAERDAYIVQLIRLVRARRSVMIPDNWDELAALPEELKNRVQYLATRLEEQVRLAEVEMSLERARLSRERTHLQTERSILEKHLKRLGINSLDELESISVEHGSTSDRRWMRFLGVNRRG